MNFAVIGLGSFGIKRASAIKKSNCATLKVVFDLDEGKTKNACKLLNVEAKNYEDILNDKSIDIICICTPNNTHKKIILESLAAQKHVFCEKPLAKNLSEAKEILKYCKLSKKTFQVGSNHRYFESVKYAKKLVDQGAIGEILSFTGRIGHDGERLKNSWFWKKEISGGGTLLDNGCHLFDLSRLFLGDFVSGTGLISNTYWKNIDVEDTAIGVFKTKDQKTASVFCSWRMLSGYIFFELNGTDGYINVDGRFDTHGGDKIFWASNKEKKFFEKDFSHIKPNSYEQEICNFVKNLKEGKKISPSVDDAYKVMEMVNFVYKS